MSLVTVTLESTESPPLREASQGGQRYIGGDQGQSYRIKLSNPGHNRVCVVVTVDAINVQDAKPGAHSGTGILVNGMSSVTIEGWRTSLENVAAFRISTEGDSYAASQGATTNVGVIGAAVFEEVCTRRPVAAKPAIYRSVRPAVAKPASASLGVTRGVAAKSAGTAFGESVASSVTMTTFDRATTTPAEVHVIRYDLTSSLVAQGIMPADVAPSPDPFPASSPAFCPRPK